MNQSNHPQAPSVLLDAEDFRQPSAEQVAKSMARSLRFFTPCTHSQERQRQIEEGRKMAYAEFGHSGPREHASGTSRPHPHNPARPKNPSTGSRKHRQQFRQQAPSALAV